MDSDIMPTGNLDYLFLNSDGPSPSLKPNLVVAGRMEPANGGFFMLEPGEHDLSEMDTIIQRRQQRAQTLPHPYFDPVEGWGHVIKPPDYWEFRGGKKGTNWTFWADFGECIDPSVVGVP
jgi:hypothetical protein